MYLVLLKIMYCKMTKVQNHEEGWKGEKGQCNGHEPKIISHITMDILKYHFLQHHKNHSNSKCNFQINEAPNIFCCMLVMETMFKSDALFLLGLATIG